jgi:hypothetical protein
MITSRVLRNGLAEKLKRYTALTVAEFNSDLDVIDRSQNTLINTLQTSFRKYGLVSVLLSDKLYDDIRNAVDDYSTKSIQYQLAYATGKFNANLSHLYSEFLDVLRNYPDIYYLAKLQKPGSENGLELHHQALRSLIDLDFNSDVKEFKSNVDSIVRQSNVLQVSIIATGIFLTHLGVPLVIAAPGTLACMSIGI